jgi:hypothetical protein
MIRNPLRQTTGRIASSAQAGTEAYGLGELEGSLPQ